jgi:hypothetical protein
MNWAVAVFEIICFVSFAVFVGGFAYLSYQRRRIVPALWIVLGIVAMSWLESPYDNAMYAQFHPDFHRMPDWGPIGMTEGQLPWIAPIGYNFYFLLPALIAVALANALVKRTNWSRTSTLLAVGLGVGMLWDFTIEVLQAQYLHLWTFSRAVPGLAVSNDMGLYPSYTALAMGSFIMGATYLIGNLTADGDSVIDAWAKSRSTSPVGLFLLQAFGYVGFCTALYLSKYIPLAIAKYAGMLTQTGVLIPYPGDIGMQPESAAPQSNGALGAVVVWGLLVGFVVLFVYWAKTMDRKYIQRVEPASPTAMPVPTPVAVRIQD